MRRTIFINHDEWTIAEFYQRREARKPKRAFLVYDEIGRCLGTFPEAEAHDLIKDKDWTLRSI